MAKKDLAGVVKSETHSDVQDAKNAAAAKPSNTYQGFLDAMKRKEEEAVVVRSQDLEVVDAPDDVDERAAWLKGLQEKKLLYGYNPKTGVALVLKEVSRKRIDKARGKK